MNMKTKYEDSMFSSLVLKASSSTLSTFTETSYTCFVERGFDDQDFYSTDGAST